MKRLFVLRHAKSSWAQPGRSDIERPLNERGHKQLQALQGWFISNNLKVDSVLCSPALRTQETYERLKPALENATFETIPALYNGIMDVYLDSLKVQTSDNVLIIGHNPTCDEICRYLAAPASRCYEKLLNRHFGTAALAIFDCPFESWMDIRQANCQLETFIRPKEIESQQKV